MTTDTGSAGLHMVQLEADMAALFRLARELRVPPRLEDEAYLVHAALRRELGEEAPQPFALQGVTGRRVRVLGYGTVGADELRARLGRRPAGFGACVAATVRSKVMPTRFPAGRRLGFELRMCPVIRRASGTERAKKGAEVDAFLAECWRVGPDVAVDREEVYRGWLAGRLEGHGAVLREARLEHFARRRMLRRTQGAQRKARSVERPDALMRGALEVTDPEAFARLLARGVGRHRAFGFGMLLLAPGR